MFSKSIRLKLSAAMVMLVVSLLCTAVVGKIIIKHLEDGVTDFSEKYLVASSAILNGDRDLYQARVAEQSALLGGDVAKAISSFEENAQQAFERMQAYKGLMSQYSDNTRELEGFDATFGQWKNTASKVFVLLEGGEHEAALALNGAASKQAFGELRELYNLAGDFLTQQSSANAKELNQEAGQFLLWAAVFLAIVVIISTIVTYIMPKMLVQSISQLTKRIAEISEGDGDLRLRIQSLRTDEVGELANTVDHFIEKLELLIGSVQGKSQQLSGNSQTLQQSSVKSQALSEQQSEAFSVIAAAVHEFNLSTHEVTSNVQATAVEASSTVEITKEGVGNIDDSVSQMNSLAETVSDVGQSISNLSTESEKIESVLGVIRGIAEQTNLLALNAAIEAARAGDHGRGFSVVADEVRNLATKTQESTQEIDQMIERLRAGVQQAVSSIDLGNQKVESSVEMIKSTQSLLTSIQGSATKVNDMAIQIAAAAEEQSQVTENITENLTNLTSQNSSNHELSKNNLVVSTTVIGMVEELESEVSRFKVGAK